MLAVNFEIKSVMLNVYDKIHFVILEEINKIEVNLQNVVLLNPKSKGKLSNITKNRPSFV